MKKATWCDRTLMFCPVYYALCTNEKSFHAEMKRLDVPRGEWPAFSKTDHADATTHHFDTPEGKAASIVCMDMERAKARNPLEVVGLLAHEATHIFQRVRRYIGEHSPGDEFEAYSIQWITQQLCGAYVAEL